MGSDTLGLPCPIFIINLPTASARRSLQIAQMATLDLPFTFIEADQPATIPAHEMQHRQNGWARPLRPAEVACLLSHRKAWQTVADLTQPALILEDDAVLATDLKALLHALCDVKGADYITLETMLAAKTLCNTSQPLGDTPYRVTELIRDRGGAAAYLLWPDGARKLLTFTAKFSPLADAAMVLAPGVRRFQVEPAAALQAMCLGAVAPQIEGTAASGGERPRFAGVLPVLRGKVRRLKVSALLGLRLLRHWRKVQDRVIDISPTIPR